MKRTYYKPLPVQDAKPTQSQQAQTQVAAGDTAGGSMGAATPVSDNETKASTGPAACQPICAYCGKPAEGRHGIHRDGRGVGPVVPLCNKCGIGPYPTLLDIWARISTTPREII